MGKWTRKHPGSLVQKQADVYVINMQARILI